ncbi:MAG: PilZ domain-containing protein [Phycisphaerae bacterium]
MSLQEVADVGAIGRSPVGIAEQRSADRRIVPGDVWLIDHHSSEVIQCRIVDVSDSGIALRVPIGYGIRLARSYELCSRLQSAAIPLGRGMIVSRRATVVRTDYRRGGGDAALVALRYESSDVRHTPYSVFSPPSMPV